MKLKIIIILLTISTLLLAGLAYLNYLDLNQHKKVIKNRELTITNYLKVMRAIGRSGNIPINILKKELKKEFDIDENRTYNDYNKEYYYALFPKTHKVNSSEIWDFKGLELILDQQKEFKTIQLYKP